MVTLALAVVALLPLRDTGWVRAANLTIWAVFAIDYVTRLALSTERKRFFRANVIDLLAIMPADFFRALRVLRLARLLRVVRAASILARVARNAQGIATTNGLSWVVLVAAATILGGGVTVWLIEPTIETLPDALWWATVTATTVGYGDLSPEHGAARAVAVALMLVGIGTIGMLTGAIATYFLSDGQATDPDIEHIRERLAGWEALTVDERRRLAIMLSAIAEPAATSESADPLGSAASNGSAGPERDESRRPVGHR